MFIFLYLCVIFCVASSQYFPPNPSGGLHGVPVEAQCLSFFRRERIWLPVALENIIAQVPGSGNSQIRLARHHIIPVSTLRAFFNEAVNNIREDENTDTTSNTVLSGIMNLIGFLSDDSLNLYAGTNALDQFITSGLAQMRAIQTLYVMDDENLNNPPLDTLFSAQYLVRSLYQWLPANIFIGPEPERRSDDPRDSFELNSIHVIGAEAYNRLVTINRMMNSFIQTRELSTYNEVIELLIEISRERHTPYPYNPSNWTLNVYTNKYNINTNPNNRRKREADVSLVASDPYCLKPLQIIKMNIINNNLMIVAKAVERAIKNKGFYNTNYKSWKEWYADSSWEFGIYGYGLSMAGAGLIYNAYGYKFNDNSFAVGIIGTDAINTNDNWVTLSHDFRTAQYKRDYAGQVFFDRDGRPAALLITSKNWAQMGAGWSFIYNGGKWEYEGTDSWDERRFHGSSNSLDSNALQFLIQ